MTLLVTGPQPSGPTRRGSTPAAGRWTAVRGPRQPLATGCLTAVAGLLVIDAVLGPHVSQAALAAGLAIAGVGFGLALVASTAAVLAIVPAERSGMAAGMINTGRQLGGVFGVAVLGALVDAQLTASLTHRLQQLGIPPNFQAIVIDAVTHGGVPSTPASVHNPAATGHETLVTQVIHAAQDALGSGLHLSLLVAAATLSAAAGVSLLTEHRRRRRASPAVQQRLGATA